MPSGGSAGGAAELLALALALGMARLSAARLPMAEGSRVVGRSPEPKSAVPEAWTLNQRHGQSNEMYPQTVTWEGAARIIWTMG